MMGAFIATRGPHGAELPAARKPADAQTTIRIERESEAAPVPAADSSVAAAQSALARLGLYDGTVDGLTGPKTRTAVLAYQRQSGLDPSGVIDDATLAGLGKKSSDSIETASLTGAVPTPRVLPSDGAIATKPGADPVIVQIQAGLRAFGNDGIELDGVAGARTRAAIREFQSLFGLEADGEPGDVVLAKMKDVGLVN